MKTVKIDTGEIDIYGIDWSVRLPKGVTISASEWSLAEEADVTVDSLSFSGSVTSVEVDATDASDGVHVLLNEITTSDGRTLQGALRLKVTDDA